MKQVIFGAIGTLFLSSACIAKDSDRTLELSGDYAINVTINGQSFKLLVDPDIGGSRVLNGDTATKLGLKGSMIGGRHMVGPVKLTANSNVLNYDFGDTKDKQRTFWFAEGTATDRAAGTISPAALPYPVVRFQLRDAVAGEKQYTLPLSDGGNNATLMVGGETIAVGFNLLRNETLVTASTGVLIADAYQGAFIGESVSTIIRYGIARPTRPLKLEKAMEIGGLPIDQMLVRVSDFGDASQIADSADVDQDEIVVTAVSKKKPRYLMTLGRDFLARCSALTFDTKAKQVQMSCAL
jgi:hypothetical protein